MKIFYSEKQKLHQPKFEWNFGEKVPYPEKYSREQVIRQAFEKKGYSSIMKEPREFAEKYIRNVHTHELVNHIKDCENKLKEGEEVYPHIFPYRTFEEDNKINLFKAGYHCFDVGTYLCKYTYVAARAAVDCALNGAELILQGKEGRIFAMCRPPGHHASRNYYGGYCIFNNAAIAAFYLSHAGRVAVMDLDFHHGNGTQSIFYDQANVVYISIHGDPKNNYPYFSGFKNETGEGLGKGYNFNIPLPAGTTDDEYRIHFHRALKELKKHKVKFLVLSMGFDIFKEDKLGDFDISEEFFHEIGKTINSLDMPVLACQEGGYNVENLGTIAGNFMDGFAGREISSTT
ncbi:MAG: histone deacetylase family protein [Vulcanimicrobiota bacterium]